VCEIIDGVPRLHSDPFMLVVKAATHERLNALAVQRSMDPGDV
jgi:hypothetical protein